MEKDTKEGLAGAALLIGILLVGALIGGIATAAGTYYLFSKELKVVQCEYVVDIHSNPRHICR